MRRRNKMKGRILLLCIFFTIISLPRLYNMIKQCRQYQYYTNEITRLEKDNEILLERMNTLKKEPYYTEKLLRENYGYIKEGEYIYRIKR